ncbi:SMP-30/gluconolactonase/LRE family protein [Verminephrobacter aporrectodeae subsp. tuberculatae]|uniref:SMP-30/gluconolactonase/LRE family protein n=1 Tax=Verminephrobacter aporrectodeae subsp. tuberculatae TaxID=1110392 RepID=A0ABT3KPB3_9BURK|nr:SMP-30/gluconolactonase/LRE family protein [Verminephrobacter aporrectodeae]MCW5320158.1 SMP-30/gluconolactonase/LRE family protein [Verminephrobacter aporrectodeae subsp. tuberculatae]
MAIDDVRCVAPTGDFCGEGAVWSSTEAAVYWTDIPRFLIHRFDVASTAVRTWQFDEPVVALALSNEPGRWLVALGSRLIWWWPVGDRREDHGFQLPGWPQVRLNDGRADPLGNFWVGSMRNNVLSNGDAGEAGGNEGKMYKITPQGGVSVHIEGLGIANTICWSPPACTFYTADTLANRVWAYAFDQGSATLGAAREHLSGFGRGLPDGSAMDAQGYLWNCRYGGGCIVRVAPNGEIDRVVDMPVSNVTTATFGGADRRTLYITTAATGRGPGERLAGSLWALRCEVPGLPENRVHLPG